MRTVFVLLLAAIAVVNCQDRTENSDDAVCLKAYTNEMGTTTSLTCRSFCYTKFLYPKCEGNNCTCVSELPRKDIGVQPSSTSNARANTNCQKEIRFDGEERANISCTSFCSARYLQAKCEGDYCKCIAHQVKKYPTLPPLTKPMSSKPYYDAPPMGGNPFPFKYEVPYIPSKSDYLKRYAGRYIIL